MCDQIQSGNLGRVIKRLQSEEEARHLSQQRFNSTCDMKLLYANEGVKNR